MENSLNFVHPNTTEATKHSLEAESSGPTVLKLKKLISKRTARKRDLRGASPQ